MGILKKYFCITLLIIASLATSIQPSSANNEYSDDEIKAAFIYRILYFIEWPDKTIEKSKYINVCTVSDTPLTALKETLEKQSVNGRELRLIDIAKEQISADSCRMIFLPESENASFEQIISKTEKLPILTIGDIPKFAKYGGMIGFTKINDTIKLEINSQALLSSGFKIDPNLLEVALNVY